MNELKQKKYNKKLLSPIGIVASAITVGALATLMNKHSFPRPHVENCDSLLCNEEVQRDETKVKNILEEELYLFDKRQNRQSTIVTQVSLDERLINVHASRQEVIDFLQSFGTKVGMKKSEQGSKTTINRWIGDSRKITITLSEMMDNPKGW